MTTHDSTTHGGGALPIACALTPADLAAQATRWQQLAAQAMTGRAETAQGVRITFRSGPGVEDELSSLLAVEQRCCPWATWTVETGAQQIVLDVASAGDGIATLHTMFTSLDPSSAASCG